MKAILWGLIADEATAVRVARGLLLAILTYALDATHQGQPLTLRSALLAAGGFLVGWLRAGEKNTPQEPTP